MMPSDDAITMHATELAVAMSETVRKIILTINKKRDSFFTSNLLPL